MWTRLIGRTRETTVHGSRDVNQEINRRENPIVFLTAFSLFMRAPNTGLKKFLNLFRKFVFYIFPDLQSNSLDLFIHAEHPPPPKVVQLVVYLLTHFYNSKSSYPTVQPARLEGKEFRSSLLKYLLSLPLSSNGSILTPSSSARSRHSERCQKTCCSWSYKIYQRFLKIFPL